MADARRARLSVYECLRSFRVCISLAPCKSAHLDAENALGARWAEATIDSRANPLRPPRQSRSMLRGRPCTPARDRPPLRPARARLSLLRPSMAGRVEAFCASDGLVFIQSGPPGPSESMAGLHKDPQ